MNSTSKANFCKHNRVRFLSFCAVGKRIHYFVEGRERVVRGILALLQALWAFLAVVPCWGAYWTYYSPADSILYAQCDTLPAGYTLLYRFRDGGARIEKTAHSVPGWITSFDAIPGHLFTSYEDVYGNRAQFKSDDYGETWDSIRTMPAAAWPYCGELAGQSQGFDDLTSTLKLTSDSWQTYNSVHVNLYSSDLQDSLYFTSLSYRMGLLYALSRTEQRLCMSSDSGHTWSAGSCPGDNPLGYAGAVDELWGQAYLCEFSMITDTGRTIINPLFVAHPPERPYDWHFYLAPTNLPGEAYVLTRLDWWETPYITEHYVYHIQDYGARVDSFYYRLVDFQIPDAAPATYLPRSFALSAYPNPFNSSVRLQWDPSPNRNTVITVTDLLGRQVWRWQGMNNTVRWDGKDGSGTALANGKYWVTIRSGERTAQTLPVILLK